MTFEELFADWRRLLATVPTVDAKAAMFSSLAQDAAGYVVRGLDRAKAVDELYDIAVSNGIVEARGVDTVQVVISDAFMQAQYEGDNILRMPVSKARDMPLPALPPIMGKTAFLTRYGMPPDYLIDDLLQRGFIYALTGQTGHAKTAVALLLARLVSSADANAMLGSHKVSKGRVLYFVGENPDDVAIRIKGSDAVRQDDPAADKISFVPGIFDIERMIEVIVLDARKYGEVSLIVVDTSAAYFLGNEELSNTQMGGYARLLRRLTTLPGHPCVLVLCHPIKHVQEPSQLLPRGGSAYLAEMDGNLTLWRTANDVVVLDHTKLRGPAFQPLSFQLQPIRTPKLLDAKGRQITTIEANVISAEEEDDVENRDTEEEDCLLAVMLKEGDSSLACWALALGWRDGKGELYKQRVKRVIDRLSRMKPKLVTKIRNQWTLTEEGKTQARKAGLRFMQQEEDAAKWPSK